jgi:hypothetical protein
MAGEAESSLAARKRVILAEEAVGMGAVFGAVFARELVATGVEGAVGAIVRLGLLFLSMEMSGIDVQSVYSRLIGLSKHKIRHAVG